jgi:hypothetical protein
VYSGTAEDNLSFRASVQLRHRLKLQATDDDVTTTQEDATSPSSWAKLVSVAAIVPTCLFVAGKRGLPTFRQLCLVSTKPRKT